VSTQSEPPAANEQAQAIPVAPSPRATSEHLPFELQGGEHVVLFERRHWIYLWPRLIFHGLIGLIAIGIFLFVMSFIFGLGGTAGTVAAVICLLWGGYWAVRMYFDWYSYHNDIWVVTNQRVIDAIKPNFFRSRLASADLIDLEDITVEHNGLLATVFHFGTVRCQTAGERPNFSFEGVAKPGQILATLDSARDAARREGRGALH
jgi:hypothetical protein